MLARLFSDQRAGIAEELRPFDAMARREHIQRSLIVGRARRQPP